MLPCSIGDHSCRVPLTARWVLLTQGRVVLLNPSGPGVSDEIASALRRDDELIDLKVNGLRQKVTAHPSPPLMRSTSVSQIGFTTSFYSPFGKGRDECGGNTAISWTSSGPWLKCTGDVHLRVLLAYFCFRAGSS